jgi:N-glycosidase YbiA
MKNIQLDNVHRFVNVIAFTKVGLPYGWLGNMAPFPLVYDGQKYLTSEALFQCLRYEGFPEVQKQIRDCPSPMGAKMQAKKYKHLIAATVEMMGEEDIQRMLLCLRLKLATYRSLQAALLATGERVIIEDVGARASKSGKFWGAKWDEAQGQWVGQNVLGSLWMQIREELAEQTHVAG